MLDIFAWIVLPILLASGLALFFIAGYLPGAIAKSRGHPWAQAVTVAGWVTLIWLCLMASHNHLGLCGFPGPS
jgi:Protein of unknown function (DUF3302)